MVPLQISKKEKGHAYFRIYGILWLAVIYVICNSFSLLAGYQNGQPPFQGHRTEQHEQCNNYIQQPAAMPNRHHNMVGKVEQAVFNPRGPGRGIPLQTHSPSPAPGRDNNYMSGVANGNSSNFQGRQFLFIQFSVII